MKHWRQLGSFLILNVIVSAFTTWLVLTLWTRSHPQLLVDDLPQVTLTFNGGAETAVIATQSPQGTPADFSGQMEFTAIVGAGDLANERALIRYNGEGELSLAGWRLADEDGNEYVFPALSMYGGGAVTVYTKAGNDSVTELHWGREESTWEVGEQATLLDPGGNVQASYVIP